MKVSLQHTPSIGSNSYPGGHKISSSKRSLVVKK